MEQFPIAHWSREDYDRYKKLVDQMALEVVKGSPLLKTVDKTSIGLTLARIAWGVIQANYYQESQNEVYKTVFA